LPTGHDGGLPVYGYLGRGLVTSRVVSALVAETLRAQDEWAGCAVLWILHFEPAAGDNLLRLHDPQGLLATAIAQTQPAGLLCGHTHLASRQDMFAGVPVFVCGSTTQWYAPHGNYLQVVTVEVDPSGHAAPQVSFQSF